MGGEVKSREARSRGWGVRPCMDGRGGTEGVGKGTKSIPTLGLEGPPQIPKYESVPGQESKPQAGPPIVRLPSFFPLASEAQQPSCTECCRLPGASSSSVLTWFYFTLTVAP